WPSPLHPRRAPHSTPRSTHDPASQSGDKPEKRTPPSGGVLSSSGSSHSAARGITVDRGDLGHDLAVDHRQAVARALVHADAALGAVIAIGDVVAHRDLGIAQGDAVGRLAVGAHAAGGAIRVAVGHVVGDHARGLRTVVDRAALAVDALDHAATDVTTVDFAAGEAATHGARDRCQLAAIAAADLVADQAADDRAGHGAADVAVALGQALLHHHVL